MTNDPARPAWTAAEIEQKVARGLKEGAARGAALVLSPYDPVPSAKVLIARCFTVDGVRAVHHHRGTYYLFNDRCYAPAEDADMRARTYVFLNEAKKKANFGLARFAPTKANVTNVIDALCAVSNLPAEVTLPAWLDGDGPPPAELLVCANGILHLPTRELLPLNPRFVSHVALDYDYDPDAPDPEVWFEFTDSLWDGDSQFIETLQEICGYLLIADTRQQKIFLVVGPMRSGKGTIARVQTALLGRDNVCAPTLASLGTNFGIAPLINKPLAIVSDARLGGRTDQAVVAERLLSISGEDAITIDRKFKAPWTGRLPTRFMVMTNELPRIADASGALASRFIVLQLTESFLGREDHGLADKLLGELPGILNWALEGLDRLQKRGHFIQPASASEALENLETLGSPTRAFVREMCVVGPSEEVTVQRIYAEWCAWCERQGMKHVTNKQTFGRDLRAAVPTVNMTQPRDGGSRERHYAGIGLARDGTRSTA